VKTHIDEVTNLRLPYLPNGRFLHVPPSEPVSNWRTDFGTPWWKVGLIMMCARVTDHVSLAAQDQNFCIGNLSHKTRTIEIVNILTQQRDMLQVCFEETVHEIRERYLEYNAHCASYTWKHLQNGEFVPLDMQQTLKENGMEDESDEFERLSINQDYYTPVVHLYFNDDLTVQ